MYFFTGKQENISQRSVKERLGVPTIVPPNSNKVLNLIQPKTDNVKTDDMELDDVEPQNDLKKDEKKVQAAAAIIKSQELLAAKQKLKKNHEEKKKETAKIAQNLRKRKQDLLEKQLAQQKLLISKLEKGK